MPAAHRKAAGGRIQPSGSGPWVLARRARGGGGADMRIVVLTDVHANLPALRAALKAIRAEGYDAIFHTGDAIGIGPVPAETLDLLLETPRLQCVMGNHEAWFVEGLPQPQPPWMSD